ncbi:MAG: radical SAM protein [FCB group bacterium]|nr:radical SAM protein [FCB group bacterium]
MRLLLAHPNGEIFEHPYLEAAAWDGQNWLKPEEQDFVPLPDGAKLFTMPERYPVGYNPKSGIFEIVSEFDDGVDEFIPWAVSAFLPPSYLRLLLPAYSTSVEAPFLTQWAYTALAANEDDLMVPAVKVDASERWNPGRFDDEDLTGRVEELSKKFADNRIVQHIAHCATQYHCFAAKNFFLGRWEAPLPTARKCNATCLGCLSLQTGDTPSSHQRISFTPTPEEIAEVALFHLENAEDPLVSFGQGCEGDPLVEWELVSTAVGIIRKATDKGTIHLNTNGSIPEAVPSLAEAGLNSVRVSLNSARPDNYHRYFRPEGYKFDDVIEFIRSAKQNNLFVHVNLLIIPGFSDMQSEIDAFCELVDSTGVDLVQLKNLNIDPEYYFKEMKLDSPPAGMVNMMEQYQKRVPGLRYGYFNLQKEKF